MVLENTECLSDDDQPLPAPPVRVPQPPAKLPRVAAVEKYPRFGVVCAAGGRVNSFRPFCLPSVDPLKLRLVPPKRMTQLTQKKLKTKKLIKKSVFVRSYGTIRVFSSTFCATTRYLSERGKQDLSTQIYHSSAYKAALKAAKVPRSPKRRFVMPRLGEWMVGLPANWTDPDASVRSSSFLRLFPPCPEAKPLPVLSCFSGVGGLELGVRQFCHAKAYVERDCFCKAVLERRMADGLLEKGPIYSDITKFVPSAELSKVILGMIGGFPCQGSSRSGKRLGLSDPRTGLIREMFRLIDVCPGMRFALLDDVGGILALKLKPLMDFVVKEFRKRGFDLRWATVKGHNVGAHVYRERVFILTTRYGYKFEDIPLKGAEYFQAQCQALWSPHDQPPRASWLTDQFGSKEKKRLCCIGNIVVPKVAEFAMTALVTELQTR